MSVVCQRLLVESSNFNQRNGNYDEIDKRMTSGLELPQEMLWRQSGGVIAGALHTFRRLSSDGRERISARALIVLPRPMSSAKMPPLLVPSSICFNQAKASF